MQNEKIGDEKVEDNESKTLNLDTRTPLAEKVANISGNEKAAIFLLTLKDEVSEEVPQEIFSNLKVAEQDKIILKMMDVSRPITSDVRGGIMDDFLNLIRKYGKTGEIEDFLTTVYKGTDREGEEIAFNKPFRDFRDIDSSQLYGILRDESPQTIALVLSYLPSDQSAEVLQMFGSVKRINEISKRIAKMSTMEEASLKEVEKALEEKLGPEETRAGEGSETLAQILNSLSRDVSDMVLEDIGEEDPERRRKIEENMFTFDDVRLVSDTAIFTQVMKNVDREDLAIALKRKGPGDEIYDKFERVLPDAMWETILELREPAVPISTVNDARRRIVEAVKDLQATGQLEIQRAHEEMV